MLEQAAGVLSSDRRECCAHHLYQSLPAASFSLSQDSLDLCEGFLDGAIVRRVGRQVQKLAASLFDQLSYPIGLVCRQVVHHHNPPSLQLRSEEVLYVGLEHFGGGGPLHCQA